MVTLAAPGAISASGSVGPGTRLALFAWAVDSAPGQPTCAPRRPVVGVPATCWGRGLQ